MPDTDHNNGSSLQEGAHHARDALKSLRTRMFHAQFPLGEAMSFWLPVRKARGYKGAEKTGPNGPVGSIG